MNCIPIEKLMTKKKPHDDDDDERQSSRKLEDEETGNEQHQDEPRNGLDLNDNRNRQKQTNNSRWRSTLWSFLFALRNAMSLSRHHRQEFPMTSNPNQESSECTTMIKLSKSKSTIFTRRNYSKLGFQSGSTEEVTTPMSQCTVDLILSPQSEMDSSDFMEADGLNAYWDDEELTCNVCDRAFKTPKLLEKHQQKNRHWCCDTCEGLFDSLMQLEHHKEEYEHWTSDEEDFEFNERDIVVSSKLRRRRRKIVEHPDEEETSFGAETKELL